MISMISLIPKPGIGLATRPLGGRRRVSILQYAAEQGIADEEAIPKGIEKKSKEIVEKGAEAYTPV